MNSLIHIAKEYWPSLLQGTLVTLELTCTSLLLSIVCGLIGAFGRLAKSRVIYVIATAYVEVVRGTPLILQLLIWFNLALVFPRIEIPGLFSIRMVDVMTPWVATLLGLGINQGAYTAEVVRSGILSVDTGQTEAAVHAPRERAQPRLAQTDQAHDLQDFVGPPRGQSRGGAQHAQMASNRAGRVTGHLAEQHSHFA